MQLNGNLDLLGGELRNARSQAYEELPTFDSGTDHGRLIFVSSGAGAGYWFGGADGTDAWQRFTTGSVIGEYAVLNETILDASPVFTETLVPLSVAPQRGLLVRVEVSASVGAGSLEIELFEDVGMTRRVYARVMDLAEPTPDDIPAYYESDHASGRLYLRLTNLTGVNITIVSLTFKSMAVIPVTPAAPPGAGSGINAGVAGDGIGYDAINARLDVDLASDGGLEFGAGAPGDRELKIKLAPSSGLALSGDGLAASGLVATTGAQTIAGVKTFSASAIALTPAASPGPPAAGTWAAGSFYLDSASVLWFCSTGGTPGTWIVFSTAAQEFGPTYTATVAAGAAVDVELATLGRKGRIEKLWVWGCAPAYAAATRDLAFRITIHPTSLYTGRDMIGMFAGQIRTTLVASAVLANEVVIPVQDVDTVNLDDLARLRQLAGPLEEFARVTVRTTGSPPTITVDENIDNALAEDDLVMYVTEFTALPWWNADADPNEAFKLFLRLHNDGPTDDVIFGFMARVESIGGGIPI